MIQNQPGILINNGKYNHTMYYFAFVLHISDAEMIYTSYVYDDWTGKSYVRLQSTFTDHMWTLEPESLE